MAADLRARSTQDHLRALIQAAPGRRRMPDRESALPGQADGGAAPQTRSKRHGARAGVLGVMLVVGAAGAASLASAQSLTGSWQITVEEISNTCGDPLGPAEANGVDILESGGLFAVDVPGGLPGQTPIEGRRSGSDLELGFEVFEDGGATLYDPADSSLTRNAAGDLFSGTLGWEFYWPEACAGTETWSFSRAGAGTPGNLSGSDWTVTAVQTGDTCDPIDPTPVVVPVTIEQSGPLVEFTVPVDFGQTRIRGRVSGQTIRLGLAIRESGGDLTVFDANDNPLTIASDFASFTGTMHWTSHASLICTGVDGVTAYLPEPAIGGGLVAGGLLLLLAATPGRARRPPSRFRPPIGSC
ncbi:MAG: hypothetical protein R3F35_15555 [Myxococcota bacterium]